MVHVVAFGRLRPCLRFRLLLLLLLQEQLICLAQMQHFRNLALVLIHTAGVAITPRKTPLEIYNTCTERATVTINKVTINKFKFIILAHDK